MLRQHRARADVEDELLRVPAARGFVVQLGQQLEAFGELVPQRDAGDPSVVAARGRERATDLEVRIERTEIALYFDRKQIADARVRRCRVVQPRRQEFDPGIRRHLPAAFALIEEAPFHRDFRVAEAVVAATGIGDPWHFEVELHAFADAVVEIRERRFVVMRCGAALGGPGEIDLPIPATGRSGIVGQERRSGIGERIGGAEYEDRECNETERTHCARRATCH